MHDLTLPSPQAPPEVTLVDDLIDTANRLHFQAGAIEDDGVSGRLHDLARQIEEIAKQVDRSQSRR